MNKSSNTEQRVLDILKRMQNAMPEIRRQIEVYEKSIKTGNLIISPKIGAFSGNV